MLPRPNSSIKKIQNTNSLVGFYYMAINECQVSIVSIVIL